MPHASGRQPAKRKLEGTAAVDRALSILMSFAGSADSLSLTQIAASTGLHKSTVLRLLASLQKELFVLRRPDGRYQLGPTLYRLGSRFADSLKVEQHVAPALQELVDRTGETAALFTRQGNARLCVLRVESPQAIRHQFYTGEIRPLTDSSSGKVLTTFERGAREANSKSLRALPFVLLGARDNDLVVISMPIFGIDDSLIGAISVSGPLSRLGKQKVREVSRLLVVTAERLTSLFGGDPKLFAPLAKAA